MIYDEFFLFPGPANSDRMCPNYVFLSVLLVFLSLWLIRVGGTPLFIKKDPLVVFMYTLQVVDAFHSLHSSCLLLRLIMSIQIV